MQFSFSIKSAIRNAWSVFKKNYALFLLITIVLAVLEIANRMHGHGFLSGLLSLFVFLAIMIWIFVSMKTSLLSVSTPERLPVRSTIRSSMPTFKQLFSLIAVLIIEGLLLVVPVGICIGIGLSLLIHGVGAAALIFGVASFVVLLYIGTRFHFAVIAYIDGKGIIGSIKYSLAITEGSVFWMIVLVMLLECVLIFIGAIMFGVGLLIAYPLSVLLSVQLYRALSGFHMKKQNRLDAIEPETETVMV